MLQVSVNFPKRFFDQDVGKRGYFRGGLGQSCDTQHVAQHDANVLTALEARQQGGRIRLKGTGTHAGECLFELFARVRAIQAMFASKAIEEVGILHQRLAQPGAESEDQHGVMNERKMLIEQPHEFGRTSLRQPLKLVYGCVRVRGVVEQRQKRAPDIIRCDSANEREGASSCFVIGEADTRRNCSFGLLRYCHTLDFIVPAKLYPATKVMDSVSKKQGTRIGCLGDWLS